jgi:hypothetical protein
MMKRKQVALSATVLVAVGLVGFVAGALVSQERRGRIYELRTYTTLPGRLPALHKRFAEHTMKLFENHSIKNEAYWVPTDDTRKDNTLIYLVSHENREAADRNWKAFSSDPGWIQTREASRSSGKILAKRPERVFMQRTDYSPLLRP